MSGGTLPVFDELEAVEAPTTLNRHARRAQAAKASRPNGRLRAEPIFQMDAGDSYGYRILHPTKGWRRYSEKRVDNSTATQGKLSGALSWWAGIPALVERAARG